jgi:hypothetical protein
MEMTPGGQARGREAVRRRPGLNYISAGPSPGERCRRTFGHTLTHTHSHTTHTTRNTKQALSSAGPGLVPGAPSTQPTDPPTTPTPPNPPSESLSLSSNRSHTCLKVRLWPRVAANKYRSSAVMNPSPSLSMSAKCCMKERKRGSVQGGGPAGRYTDDDVAWVGPTPSAAPSPLPLWDEAVAPTPSPL